jgi:transposase
MIPSGVEVYVASTPVDFRKGPVSLMALVRDGGVDPSTERSTSSARNEPTG